MNIFMKAYQYWFNVDTFISKLEPTLLLTMRYTKNERLNVSYIRYFELEDPISSTNISLFFTDIAITATEIQGFVKSSTPSVTWTVRHGTDRSATGAEVITGVPMAANSFVWLETINRKDMVIENE